MRQIGLTVCAIGTGPSLRLQQVEAARRRGFLLYGCNRTFLDIPDLTVLHACNFQFWDYYAEQVKDYPAKKWTTRPESAAKYPWLNYIEEVDRTGLSLDPTILHHGHSTGYQLIGLAFHHGADRIVLIGYDLHTSGHYDGLQKSAGKRHYFGEYDSALVHWPQKETSIAKDGRMVGLIPYYESVARQHVVEIINASPGSALTCFPTADIESL